MTSTIALARPSALWADRSIRQGPPAVTAIRFGLATLPPFRATYGILLADTLHRAVTKRLDGGREDLLAHAGTATDHRHAHWVPLSVEPVRSAALDGLLVWAPVGLHPEEVATIIGTRWLSGRRGGIDSRDGFEATGRPRATLRLQSVGTVEQVAPELCGPSHTWHSLTPYLPVRHYKRSRGSYDDFLAEDVRRELQYRKRSTDVSILRVAGLDRWASDFRRCRADERLRRDVRPGFGLELTFHEPVHGPLLLGQLSHFGYGIFVPGPEAAP